MEHIKIKIPSHSHIDRLDKIIKTHSSKFSRRRIKQLIHRGSIFINNKRIRRASFQVNPPVTIDIYLQNHQDIEQSANKIHWHNRIIHHDTHLMAIQKPPGIPTAPTIDSAIHNVY